MKRTLIIGMTLLLAVPVVEARRVEKKAGEITGDTYRDKQYGFELKIGGNWKAKMGKADENKRLTLTQRDFGIPADYVDYKDYTQIPQAIIYVDTTTFGAHVFIDSLMSLSFKSDQKSDILKVFTILNEPDLVPKQRSRLEIAGQSALMWKAQAKYTKEVQDSESSSSGKFVQRSYGGAIAAVKVGSYILLIHVMTEWEFFEPVLQEMLPMIESIKVLQEEEG